LEQFFLLEKSLKNILRLQEIVLPQELIPVCQGVVCLIQNGKRDGK